MRSAALYDRIGGTYTATRREDPRIAPAIHAALGDAHTVLNVGAGTGSYEPHDKDVVAVEPSAVMIAQRPRGAAPVVRANVEALPFEDSSFDTAMAVLSDHHWENHAAGLRELRRVARRRVVLFTWDRRYADAFWLTRDYLPSPQAPACDADRAHGPLSWRSAGRVRGDPARLP
jgi:SAM-dependent methyltransferase